MLKVNYKNTLVYGGIDYWNSDKRPRTAERHWRRFSVVIVNFEHVSHLLIPSASAAVFGQVIVF